MGESDKKKTVVVDGKQVVNEQNREWIEQGRV